MTAAVDPLVNPIWHALSGAHLRFGDGNERARRYHPAVTPFGSLRDASIQADWDALAALLGPSGEVFTFAATTTTPPGWSITFQLAGVQLGIDDATPVPSTAEVSPSGVAIEQLGPADVDEMLDLVARTEPGPFLERTIELGTFLGVRVDGALAAMAGQRLRVETDDLRAVEISAVCTDADHRGRGVAAALVCAQVERIRSEGARPIMHVSQSNTDALRVYERLGFEPLREFTGVNLVAPA